jgi:glycerol dehydrogenase
MTIAPLGFATLYLIIQFQHARTRKFAKPLSKIGHLRGDMTNREPFFPNRIFSGGPDEAAEPPRVLIAPHRYIQGKGALDRLGRYLSILPSRKPVVLMTKGGKTRLGSRIEKSLRQADVEPRIEIFGGECSTEEVDRLAKRIRESGWQADAVIAIGGGKCIDAGKCVSFRLGVPAVICPTIASTDAPCSAVSVMYTADGVGKGPEFFPHSPALVVVDTQVIASSPLRHLIAGMGDALATFYEARSCHGNPSGRNMIGTRMTIAAMALAELCARTIFEDGKKALETVKRGDIDECVERIVEANTLLSGVGFESGGLSVAHAMAAGLTVIPSLHRGYLHGELVGIGLLAQLLLEKEVDEARKVGRFLADVGLPACLQQLQLDIQQDAEILMEAMTAAMKEPFAHNEPFTVNPGMLLIALGEADQLGSGFSGSTSTRDAPAASS